MAEMSKSCSVGQAYNFQKDAQECIGHILSCKMGDKALDVDQKVKNPIDQSDVKVVGVLSGVGWNGGYAEPVSFSCQVSVGNKGSIKALKHGTLSKTDVELKYVTYDYDQKAKVFYKSFHTNDAVLKGLIQKAGGALVFDIAEAQSREVASPANYAFSMSVMPQDSAQTLHMAFSNELKQAAQWGVSVGV